MATFSPTLKQHQFFQTFGDETVLEILYGGAAGGGKSYVLWSMMIIKCLEYPGITVGLARNTLADIKKNTIASFYEVSINLGLVHTSYNYNSQEGKITFKNGSVIQFFELRYMPSDPNYDRFGGALLTFGCIEEAAGVPEKGKSIFQSRLGRWMNDEYNIMPQLFMTCNPGMNFLYSEFYRPWQKGELARHRTYIPALLSDNIYQSKHYKRNLELTLSEQDKSRLLEGQWDFDSDKARLIKYDTVLDIYNLSKYKSSGDYYISADIAFTGDKCIILLWQGLEIFKIYNYKGDEPEEEIIRIRDEYNVDPRKIVYDSDGVGKYLKGKLRMAYDFINNGVPINKENYSNIKSQVYFKLAELINMGLVKSRDTYLKEELIQEVYEIKSVPMETVEGKMSIIKKKEVVKNIGRSPDISDAMAYRMVFELKKKVGRSFFIG